jgi:hypothetical protein
MTCYSLTRCLSSLGIHAAVLIAMAGSAAIADAQPPLLVRVRSENPSMTAVIVEAAERSATFRRLIETIDATDGIVYVVAGRCGHGVPACLALSVTAAGRHRLLRILVEPHKYDKNCHLMAAIGHELQHAIELLSEPNVRDYHAAYSLFDRIGKTAIGRFETEAAQQAGLDVDAEACVRPAVAQLVSQSSP